MVYGITIYQIKFSYKLKVYPTLKLSFDGLPRWTTCSSKDQLFYISDQTGRLNGLNKRTLIFEFEHILDQCYLFVFIDPTLVQICTI